MVYVQGVWVIVYVFSEDVLFGLINVGIDCIEYGIGFIDDIIVLMFEYGIVLVFMLINLENFLGIVDVVGCYLIYVVYMCDLYVCGYGWVVVVWEVGVLVYVGIDVGSMIEYGWIVDEVVVLQRIGMIVYEVLGVVCWDV